MEFHDTSASSVCQEEKLVLQRHPSSHLRRTGEVLNWNDSRRIELVVHKPSNAFWAEKRISCIGCTDIERVSKLQHPHLVQLITYFKVKNSAVLYMEYVSHSVYLELLLSGKFSEARAISVFRQLCLAVQYLHSNELVHGDIRPENILLDSAGNVKLTICSQQSPDSHYAAPQGVTGKREDFWALGTLLHEMLCNSLPSPELNQRLSPAARDLITQLMAGAASLSLDSVLSHVFFGQSLNEASLLNKLERYLSTSPWKPSPRVGRLGRALRVNRPRRKSFAKSIAASSLINSKN